MEQIKPMTNPKKSTQIIMLLVAEKFEKISSSLIAF
jgi:hypothetical protein